MYKLELDDKQINDYVDFHLRNMGSGNNDDLVDKQDTEIIKDALKGVNIFYDDDPQYNGQSFFYVKHHNDNLHHAYKVLVTRKKFRLWTEISIPQNQLCYEEFNLISAMQALSFEVSDPRDYMEESEDSAIFKKALKHFKKNSDKIYQEFGEMFYSCILGGSL